MRPLALAPLGLLLASVPAHRPAPPPASPPGTRAEASDASTPPNVLILLADDLGVDVLGAYAEGPDPAPTPTLDGLAQRGVLFRNAWAHPVCSPTRATIQTGRHPWRLGIGMQIPPGATTVLPDSETTLPELLAMYSDTTYATAAIGKWHLGNDPWAPNAAGYDHFAGTPGNLVDPEDYFQWTKIVDGVAVPSTTYATTDAVDSALQWIAGVQEPWLCYVAFHAPHSPFHAPPAHLHTIGLPNVDPRLEPRPFYKAMVEALDTEIGRLLAGLGESSENTLVVFLGDNGTPREAARYPFVPSHAKLTPYEGGINVPLIVAGPGVVSGGESHALVSTTDLFATLADVAGIDLATALPPGLKLDSISLMPYLADPQKASLRGSLYSELFTPNGPGVKDVYWHMLRDQRYKLIVRREAWGVRRELYDLLSDPFERRNLIGGAIAPWVRRVLLDLNRSLAQQVFTL